MDNTSEEIKKFILDKITSIEQISILLLLQQDPQKKWTTSKISEELRSADLAIEKRLEDLFAAGVLNKPEDSEFYYSPASEKIKSLVAGLIETYQKRPTWVIDLIYSRPIDAIQAFSEAFKIRREK